MNKVIGLYIFLIIIIAISAFFTDAPNYHLFQGVYFPHSYHVIFEAITSSLLFLIFFRAQIIYYKTQNKRMILVATGFLAAGMLNVYHIAMTRSFPYDILTVENLHNNPHLFFLIAEKFLVSISLFATVFLTAHSSPRHREPAPLFRLPILSNLNKYLVILRRGDLLPFRKIIFISTFFLLLIAIGLYKIIFMLAHAYHLSEILLLGQTFMPVIEAIYFITAFIYADAQLTNKKSIFSIFITGLIILGMSQIFYINPELVQGYEILAHVLKITGLIFILAGLKNVHEFPDLISQKQKIAAYLSIFLISTYWILTSIISLIFNISFPVYASNIIIEFLLIAGIVQYLSARKLTQLCKIKAIE